MSYLPPSASRGSHDNNRSPSELTRLEPDTFDTETRTADPESSRPEPNGSEVVERVADPEPGQRKSDELESKTSPARSQSSRPRPRHRRLAAAWWAEAGACILSFAAFFALFAILYSYGGNPSPNWPNGLSINTVVSVFATILKTCIVFVLGEGIGQLKWSWFSKTSRPLEDIQTWDDATRGPLGATILIGNLRGRSILASIGALVIVLTLAVDPLAQQILRYHSCAIQTTGFAQIPRANTFSGVDGAHIGPFTESMPPGAQNAINAAFFKPTSIPTFDCSSGNCTWHYEYSTLAFCSTCQDVTAQLVFKNDSRSKSSDHYVTSGHHCNASTSLGDLIANQSCTLLDINYEQSLDFAALEASPQGIVNFLVAKVPGGTVDPTTLKPFSQCTDPAFKDTWPCQGYGAASCSLSSCVKTFKSLVSNGQLTENLVNIVSDFGFDAFGDVTEARSPSMVDLKCLGDKGLQFLRDQGYKFNDTEKWLPYNLTSDDHLASVAPNCVYVSSITWSTSLNSYLGGLLGTGAVTGFPYVVGTESAFGFFHGPQILQTIFNYGNVTFDSISDVFNNVSIAVTNYMRENAVGNGSSPALGDTFENKICVEVRWIWFIYPIVLLVLTLTFFVCLLTETWPTESQPRIWKSSPLALLFHGLSPGLIEESEAHDRHDLDEVDGMEEVARATSVKLEGSHDHPIRFIKRHAFSGT